MALGERKKTRWLICLALVLVTLAVYWRVVGFDFVNYDDSTYVTENDFVKGGLTIHGIIWAFTHFHGGNWHPLTWISHMMDCQFFGMNAGAHHLMNAAFHTANAVLLFLLLFRLTGAQWRSALVAALFALHPLHVESVAWVAERKDVLSTFFGLLALLAYARYAAELKVKSQKSKIWFIWTLILFLLSLMAKPMLVTLPCLMLLLDFWPLQRVENTGWRTFLTKPFAKLALEKWPFFILAALSSVVTFFAQKAGGAVATTEHFPFLLRIANPPRAYFIYILKAVWPVHLAVFYPMNYQQSIAWSLFLLVVLLILSFAFAMAAGRLPYIFVGWLWFLGMLVPVIGLVQVGKQALADRYTYIPLTGVFIAVIWGFSELLQRKRAAKIVGGVFAAAVLGACAILTVRQLQYWQNSLTLFSHALAVTRDNDLAHNNLGSQLAKLGRRKEALEHYFEAARLDPGNPRYQNNLGAALAREGRYAEAIQAYTAAIRDDPTFANAYSNLGSLFLREHQLTAALTNLTEAVRLDPVNGETRNNLANALAASGNLSEALKQYSEAVRLSPKDATLRLNSGLALLKAARTNDAIAQLAEAVHLEPSSAEAHYQFGRQLFFQGQFPTAIEQLSEATKLKPDYPLAQFYLSAALAETGRFDEATTTANEALVAAQGSGQTNLATRIQEALEFYKARRPLMQKLRSQ